MNPIYKGIKIIAAGWALLLLIVANLAAQDEIGEASSLAPEDAFKKANAYYNSEDYGKAAEIYQSLLESGYKEFEVYYNLGNAYYKLGNVAESILYYERARRLRPANDDLLYNLKLANQKTADKIEKAPRLFIWDWLESARNLLSSLYWDGAFLLALWAGAAFAYVLIFSKNIRKRKYSAFMSAFSFFAAIILFAFAYMSYQFETSDSEALVFASRVEIKHSPEEDSDEFVTLHEGSKVEILEKRGGWARIKIPDGNIGWAPLKAFRII